MARFHFSLEGLLRYNVAQESQAASMLALARADEARQRERLERCRQELAASTQPLAPGGLEIGGCQYLDLYRQGLNQNMARQQRLVSHLEEVVERQRADFVEARKQRQVVEKLKERQWVAFQREEERKGYRELDDLVTFRSEKGGE